MLDRPIGKWFDSAPCAAKAPWSIHLLRRMGFLFGIWLAAAIAMQAQTFKTLINFDSSDGTQPVYTSLVQSSDGNLYGTTLGGGTNGDGTVFKITPAGTLTTIYSFCSQTNCGDGSGPYAGVLRGVDGNFYGTTSFGGTFGNGTVFKLTATGTLTTLHSFDYTAGDGAQPFAALIQASDGNFYGTTAGGGPSNAGTIFKITPSGTLTILHTFNGSDGATPMTSLVQGIKGDFYGTAGQNIFQMTPQGALTTLHAFTGPDGAYPNGIMRAANGIFYGTTYGGGSNNSCNNGCGTIFQIASSGTFTTLYNFDSTHGANPVATLAQGTDGNFYGTTYAGGVGGDYGTVFEMSPAGALTSLHSFVGTDGGQPYGPVAQATNGEFYGTATNFGSYSGGTLFGLVTGLGPFVETSPALGKVGSSVTILGSNLMGASSVTFDGTAARFTVVSQSEIRTTVPVGAKTGYVKITIGKVTLRSNIAFRVHP
jgi:uncharacterized repeat protein (TIGR03803 family)